MRLLMSVVWGAALIFATEAIAADAKRYPLPGHGALQLNVPAGWQDRVKSSGQDAPPAIEFFQSGGAPFVVTVMPMWQTRPQAPLPSKAELRKRVQYAGEGMLPFALEKDIKVLELKGAAGSGYYFSVTDNALKPGGFKFLTQGATRIGTLVVRFTVLTNDGQEQIARDALEMVKSARQMTR